MNIAAIFIRRPVMTTLVMLGILIFGIMAYNQLPVSNLPNVDFPTIQVTAEMTGASPETMASSVATPLEKQFSSIAGLDSMTSTSTKGRTRITLQFNLARNIDAAAQDVQSAISIAQRWLPKDMTTTPYLRKVNPADQPIILLALSSPTLPMYEVDEYAQTMIAQRISMISGVALVNVYGAQKYAVRIQLDPHALASREIGLDEVSAAVARSNVNMPTGTLTGPHKEFTLETSGQLFNAEAYRPLIVTYRNGSPVRLSEIARITDSVENDKMASTFKGNRAIVLAIQRQPGANTVQVVQDIRALLPKFESQIPASVRLEVMFDRSESIRESVADVKFTLVLTVCLVIMVIFVFLRNVRATVIPSLALPMSLVGTFAVMRLFDFSLDNLSLMALTLSVGFVVDDAIVMLENIVRHIENGESVLDAAMNGSKEISFTILSMTISLAAVFIPVLFMGGIVGRLFHEFAITIMSAILLSGLVSLSLTPMLCRLFLKPHGEEKHGHLFIVTERGFDWLRDFYDRTLQICLRHRLTTLIASLVLLVLAGLAFVKVPKGFLPNEDIGQIVCFSEAEQGISFQAMSARQKQLIGIVQADPDVDTVMSVIGAGGPNAGGNSGRLVIQLKARHERKATADQIITRLRPKLAQAQGIRAFLQIPPSISVGGQSTKSQYQLALQGPDTAELYRQAASLESRIREMSELLDVTSDLQLKNPQITLDIDRDKASALGVSVEQIENALYTAYGSRQVSTIYAATNNYSVIMELQPQFQRDPFALAMLYVRSSGGALIPLNAVAKIRSTLGPMSVNHTGQLPSVTISFNLKPGVSLGEAVTKVQKLANETLPATITTSFQGTAQAFQSSMQGMWLLLVMSIFVIYIVLGILYESFIHPLTILSGLPSAGFGAVVTLLIFGMDLDIYGFVGIIMLVGIVKKNAIMMIDFALETERRDHKDPAQAIYEGCLIRFRPIMMTTCAALMGTLPIALGFGAGAEARRPLGLAVVGGLVVSQILTLYLTPVYYIYLDRFSTWVAGKVRRENRKLAKTQA